MRVYLCVEPTNQREWKKKIKQKAAINRENPFIAAQGKVLVYIHGRKERRAVDIVTESCKNGAAV